MLHELRSFAASLRRLTANRTTDGLAWNQESEKSMQTSGRAGTVIFVSNRSPEAAVAQEIEAHGLVMHWAANIREAVDLLNSAREKTVIVTELALADGNWRDLVERVRCGGIPTPVVLLTSSSTAELWWDALECGIDDILPGHLVASRSCQLLGKQLAS
jgi:DNA-binding NtrC family response regulator